MAWDLTIYAIDWQKMQAETPLKDLKEVFAWIDQQYQVHQKHFTETEASVYFKELFNLRSKNICFAIQQLLNLFDEQFSTTLWNKVFLQSEASYLLSKEEIAEVVLFLKVFAQSLGEEEVCFTPYHQFIQHEITAQTWYKHPDSEFRYFADYAGVFEDWEAKIQKSKAKYFYWENSF